MIVRNGFNSVLKSLLNKNLHGSCAYILCERSDLLCVVLLTNFLLITERAKTNVMLHITTLCENATPISGFSTLGPSNHLEWIFTAGNYRSMCSSDDKSING